VKNIFYGRNARREITIVLTLVRASASEPVSLAGKYSTNLLNDANVGFEFTNSRVSLFGGCNSQSGDYKAYSNGTFSVTQFITTLVACNRDNDRVYVSALSQAVSFVRNADGSLTFRDSRGQTVLVLSPFNSKPVKEVKFDGTYRPSLNDDQDLSVKLGPNGTVNLLNGCNNQISTYKATDDGAIAFTLFAGSKRFCQDDKDSIYTTALVNSVRFVVQGGRIVLFSGSGR
jgi:heat shock protein HslJ